MSGVATALSGLAKRGVALELGRDLAGVGGKFGQAFPGAGDGFGCLDAITPVGRHVNGDGHTVSRHADRLNDELVTGIVRVGAAEKFPKVGHPVVVGIGSDVA